MNARDLAARRIHAEGGVHEGVCWGPTPADYAAADAEALPTNTDREDTQ